MGNKIFCSPDGKFACFKAESLELSQGEGGVIFSAYVRTFAYLKSEICDQRKHVRAVCSYHRCTEK